jgi:hypothetical protein
MSVPDTLLGSIKNNLDITWSDLQSDMKLSEMIERGMKYLNRKAGGTLDYSVEDNPKELLIEYCRYARSGILNEFDVAYAPMLVNLKIGNGGTYG